MPRKTECRSVFGLPVCVSQPSSDLDQSVGVRWAGILAGDQASVERTLSLVAASCRRSPGAGAGTAGASSAGAVRSRQSGGRCRSAVAEAELRNAGIIFHLRSETVSVTLLP